MESILRWVGDILLVIISLSFFQILIPDSTMSGYMKYIFSLVMLAIIIEPISVFLT